MNALSKRMLACSVAALLAPAVHAAQSDPAPGYPNRPMRFIVPFAPGAGTDTTARTIAQKLTEKWGQQFLVDNRTGAGGAIGVDYRRESAARRLHDRPHLGVEFGGARRPIRACPTTCRRTCRASPRRRRSSTSLYMHPSHAVQDDQGADRLRQGESREAQLRQLRQLHAAAFLRRAASTTWPACRSCTCRTRAPLR